MEKFDFIANKIEISQIMSYIISRMNGDNNNNNIEEISNHRQNQIKS